LSQIYFWKDKRECACQRALDQDSKDSRFKYLQEVHLKSLRPVTGRITELAQLMEGFDIETSKEFREIAGKPQDEKPKAYSAHRHSRCKQGIRDDEGGRIGIQARAEEGLEAAEKIGPYPAGLQN
jgi:hypothetical protein